MQLIDSSFEPFRNVFHQLWQPLAFDSWWMWSTRLRKHGIFSAFKHCYCHPQAAKGFSVYLHLDLNIAGLSERRLKCYRAARWCSLWLGLVKAMGALFSALLLKDAAVLLGPPSVRGIVTCQRVQSAPQQILVHKQVNSGDKGASSCWSSSHMNTSTQKNETITAFTVLMKAK